LAVLFFGEGSDAADGFGEGLVGGTRDGCPSAGGRAPGGADRVPAEPGEAETETVLERPVIARAEAAEPGRSRTGDRGARCGSVRRDAEGAGGEGQGPADAYRGRGHDRRFRVTSTSLGHEFVTSR
jgi:hypothetical protein